MGRKVKPENRNAILKAAYKLFLLEGYDNVSTNMIAREAQMHHTLVFRYFGTKEYLLCSLFESIEKKMIDYLNLSPDAEPFQNYVTFSLMKYEFSVLYPDYFRLRASLIKKTDAFIRMFLSTFSILQGAEKNWKEDSDLRMDWFYMIGGTLLLQYEFITNYSESTFSAENNDFLTNYSSSVFPEVSANKFRAYMHYSICKNVQILTNDKLDGNQLIENANQKLSEIDLVGFRSYYEKELGLV